MTDLELEQYPLAARILDELGTQMPFMLKAAREDRGVPLERRLPELEYIAAKFSGMTSAPSAWASAAVKSYVVLSLEFLKLQKLLEKTGRYLYSSERETYANAYDNENVFGDYYLPGLLLSEALWPNHYLLDQAFQHEFVERLPKVPKVLEVGVGTGYHLARLIERRPAATYHGVDISPYAVDFATRFALGQQNAFNARFELCDATKGLPVEDQSVDAVVCGEVLEHVEDPASLLEALHRVVAKGGYAFVTTVVFAASIDHVFLFEDAASIRSLIESTGWSIERDWVLPVYPRDSPLDRKRPMNYGALLRR